MDKLDNKEKIDSIYSLKGIGAFVIAFMWHYQHFTKDNQPFENVLKFCFRSGSLMVEMFFMISGFCMMYGYSERVLKYEIDFKTFIIRRIKKLYPIFLLGTIITAILEILYLSRAGETFVYRNFDLYHFVINLLMMQNGFFGTEGSFDSPSWCISICMIYYIVFYAVLVRVKSKRNVYYVFAFIAVLSIALLLSGINKPIINGLVGRGGACFSIGVLLYGLNEARAKLRTNTISFILGLLVVGFYLIYRFADRFMGNTRMTFILLVSPAIILLSLWVPVIKRVLSIKLLVILGKLSINIYLFHFPVQCMFKILEVYSGKTIDYSSYVIWGAYVISTIAFSVVYEYVIKDTYEKGLSKVILRG